MAPTHKPGGSPLQEETLFLDSLADGAPEVLGELVDALVLEFGAERGAVVVPRPDEDPVLLSPRRAGGQTLDAEELHPPEGALDSLRGRRGAVLTLRSGQAVAIPLRTVLHEERYEGKQRRRIPLEEVARTLGFVYLEGRELKMGSDAGAVRLASRLGSYLVAAAPMLRRSGTDPVTGLRSPLLLRSYLEEELQLAHETGVPLTLLLADLDAFLRGDGGGASPEEAGRLLSSVGERLATALRGTDVAVRCGGDTFAVLLPGTDAEGASVVGEKVQRAVVETAGELGLDRITCSAGFAVFPHDAEEPDGLLRRAAEALGHAKAGGGDRVLPWSPEAAVRSSETSPRDVTLSRGSDLEVMVRTFETLRFAARLASLEEPRAELLRGVAFASGATRGVYVQGGGGRTLMAARVGDEGWTPSSDLLRRANATAGWSVAEGVGPEERPLRLAIPVPAHGGILGVLALEREPDGFPPAARSAAELLVRLSAPQLRERLAEEGEVPALGTGPFQGIVGDSPPMREVYALMRKLLRTRIHVLILGETGTGKELVARAIHRNSVRAQGPFVTVDCGALPRSLADSELFGHRQGAFTDAREDRLGLIERAEGGTVFLDELSGVDLDVQARLLRFLQEGEIRRVGETEYRPVDVRVIAASNRDLKGEVEEGRLRSDLYHRLQGVTVRMPALRERREDIPALVSHFLRQLAAEEGGPPLRMSGRALQVLMGHAWPGNVRELENAVRKAALLSEGRVLEPELLPADLREGSGAEKALPIPRTGDEFREAKDELVAELTRKFLCGALMQSGGNVSRAAARTGMQRTYFHRLMRQYGVDPREFKG